LINSVRIAPVALIAGGAIGNVVERLPDAGHRLRRFGVGAVRGRRSTCRCIDRDGRRVLLVVGWFRERGRPPR